MKWLLIIIPLLGVWWFLNLIVLLEKLKAGKNYQNQKLLGAVCTFFLLLFLIYFLMGSASYV
ncbi:hypothetical protein D0S48_17920 [Psychrobacillus sp. AK 1817]|nr:hypothetical protein D0S48_17920 [Psychrobacillus sp. AK 1817]